ncbi:hypothetical protein ACW9IK_17630 [Pseudomonas gingeri]|nr:hypothetical protein [Pseudomonas gingeri]
MRRVDASGNLYLYEYTAEDYRLARAVAACLAQAALIIDKSDQ